MRGDCLPIQVILQLPILIDRSNEITITSPMTQALVDALRIEGSITKIGNEGVQIEVRESRVPSLGLNGFVNRNTSIPGRENSQKKSS